MLLGEGAYEDGPEYPTKPITPLVVRKQAYWSYLAGAFFTYGHNSMWRHPDTWSQALNSEGARNMDVLGDLFTSLDWSKLIPDQSILVDTNDTGQTWNVAARAEDGSWAMIYFSHPDSDRLNLKPLKRDTFTATWIDPRTGKRSKEEQHVRGKDANWSVPAGWQDAVLLLQCK